MRNESDSSGGPVYVGLSQSELSPRLALFEASNGSVPESPGVLPLVTGSSHQDGYWIAGQPSTSIIGGVDASATTIEVGSVDGLAASGLAYSEGEVIAYAGLRQYEAEEPEIPGYWGETSTTTVLIGMLTMVNTADQVVADGSEFPATDGVVRVDDELILYSQMVMSSGWKMLGMTRGYDGTVAAEHAVNSIVTLMAWTDPIPGSPEVLAALTGCARGAEGSTAAAHADGVAIAQAEWVPETGGDILELYPGEVLPVSVFLVADSGIPRGDYPFITTILAQDTPH